MGRDSNQLVRRWMDKQRELADIEREMLSMGVEPPRSSERGDASLLQSFPEVVVQIDPSGEIQYSNQIASGYTPEEVVGTNLFSYIPYDQHHVFQDVLEQVLTERQPVSAEISTLSRDGEPTWWQARTGLIVTKGEPSGFFIVGRDITERKQAGVDLGEAKEELERLNTELEAGNAELQTANETLQAMNEELQATNEELYITNLELRDMRVELEERVEERTEELSQANEELATANEELAAMNEELAAMNEELRSSNDKLVIEMQQRVEAQERLIDREQDLRLAQRIAHLGNVSFVPENERPEWSEEVYRIYGRDPREAPPTLEEHRDFIHPDDWNAFIEAVHLLVETGRPYELLVRAFRPDGEMRYVLTRGEAQRNKDGGFRRLVATVLDITERQLAAEKLRRSEERYRAVVDSSHDCILILDPEYRILAANKAAKDFGLDFLGIEDEVEGKRLKQVLDMETEYARRWESRLRESFDQGRQYMFDDEEWIGSRRVFSESILTPLRDSKDRVFAVAVVYRDITRKRLAREELLRSKQAAEAASRAKGEFLANMSHEIRTPLNGVVGMLHLLADTDMDGEQRSYLDTAQSSCQSLMTIISDILDFSKIEAGRIEMYPEPFNPASLIEPSARMFAPLAESRGLEFRMNVSPELPAVVEGDVQRLRQIINNLLSNAIKFTNEGFVEVEIGGRPAGDGLYFLQGRVADSGIGIPADKLDSIFEAFTQVDGSYKRRFQGSGLGLGIVKRLVEHMGGAIGVESEVDRGSVIRFEIPLPILELERIGAELPAHPDAKPSESLTVLVAEDNPVNKLLMVRTLEKLGHKVHAVASGRQALEALERDPFDLVLMDIQMPDMDGVEATRILRAHADARVRATPVVALTAHAMKGDRERFLEAGMDDYLSKPLDPLLLGEVLVRVRRN